MVPVKVGFVISCYTKILKVGNTSIQMQIEVWDSHDDSRAPIRITEGVFTFVAVDVKATNVRFLRKRNRNFLPLKNRNKKPKFEFGLFISLFLTFR